MSALAAAHGLAIDGRTLALLCQRVENQVVGAPAASCAGKLPVVSRVPPAPAADDAQPSPAWPAPPPLRPSFSAGAPCGVMDQMTAALGQQARLLALRCQPAEVEGSAAIPPHLAFWGVDSGRAHCVGGSDYRHVRVGAFMGLRIASQAAHEAAGGGGEGEAGGGEAAPLGGGYLANVPPSAWARWHEQRVPERMGGAAFLERYGSHWDAATAVDAAEVRRFCLGQAPICALLCCRANTH